MATPQLGVRARRFASPFAGQRAKVEPIHQPLYSAFILDAAAAPSEALMFQYAVGGTVATNAAAATVATQLHTNMTAAGSLATPKLFLVTGIRLVPVELGSTLINPLQDSAGVTSAGPTFTGADSNLLEDLLRVIYGSYLRFFVGTKDYLVTPTWFTPGNTGVQGDADSLTSGGATPIATASFQYFQTYHSAGRYFGLDRYPVLIPSQQNFFLSLNFPQATKPTIGAARVVYGVLDGILGRETQ